MNFSKVYLNNFISVKGLIRGGILCFVLTFCYVAVNAQTGLNVFGKMKVDKSTLDQSRLIISKDGAPFKRGGVEKNGKFDFILQFNHVYLFTFSKPGFVTKKILIDTHIPKDKKGKNFNPFEFIVVVFEQNDNQNTYAYSQPVARIHYSEFIDDFDYDTDYTKSLQARFDADKASEKEKEKAVEPVAEKIEPIVEVKTEEVKTDSVGVNSPRGGAVIRKEIEPKVNLDERNKIKAKAEADKRKVIRPGVAVDNKPKRKTIPKLNPDAIVATPVAGSDPKPKVTSSTYRHKTVDSFRQNKMNVTVITFTIDLEVTVYRKVAHDWGGVYYFKNGKSIGHWTYGSEVSEYEDKELSKR